MVLILLGLLAALIGVESGSSAPSRRQLAWLAAAGFVLGAALTVRAAGLFALLPAVLLIPLFVRGPWLRRLGSAAAVAVPAMIIVLGYASAQQATNGVFALSPGSGWNLYVRAAPFADCRYFDPPAGTEVLCESSPASSRPGGEFYGWSPQSPAHQLGGSLEASEKLGEWGRAAIGQEPKAFVSEVSRDLWRVVDPFDEPRPLSGGTPDLLALNLRYPLAEQNNRSVLEPYYGKYELDIDADVVGTLTDWQRVLRFHGPLMLLAMALFLGGLAFARGARLYRCCCSERSASARRSCRS